LSNCEWCPKGKYKSAGAHTSLYKPPSALHKLPAAAPTCDYGLDCLIVCVAGCAHDRVWLRGVIVCVAQVADRGTDVRLRAGLLDRLRARLRSRFE
jgi:hypothetical protein